MPGTLEMLKAIMEQVPSGHMKIWSELVPDRDKILRQLTPQEEHAHEEVGDIESELRANLKRGLRLIRLFESKRFLLSDQARQSDERADSADARGKELGFRKTAEGVPVLVEFDPRLLDG